jgi:hypothetical protein
MSITVTVQEALRARAPLLQIENDRATVERLTDQERRAEADVRAAEDRLVAVRTARAEAEATHEGSKEAFEDRFEGRPNGSREKLLGLLARLEQRDGREPRATLPAAAPQRPAPRKPTAAVSSLGVVEPVRSI